MYKEYKGLNLPEIDKEIFSSVSKEEQAIFNKVMCQLSGKLKELPAQLELEVTETVFLDEGNVSSVIISEICAMGVKVVIDDFGVGFSSLNYLQRLPVSTLKIDRSFVHHAPTNHRNAAIVKAVVAMGISLELLVVAEGVETLEEKEFLERIGCHEMQGFLFGQPLPEQEFAERFLQNDRRFDRDIRSLSTTEFAGS